MKRLLIVTALGAITFPLLTPSAAAGGGGCHGSYQVDGRGVSVSLSNACFDPLVVRVDPGQSVTWTNSDDMAHNLVGSAMEWGSDGDLRRGDAVTIDFDKPGTFPYACTLHPGMIGAVVVGDGVRTTADISQNGVSGWRQPRPAASAKAGASPSVAARPTESPAAEPAPSSSAAVVAAAPAEPSPATAAAAPTVTDAARTVATVPAASTSPDRGPLVALAIVLIGMAMLGAVVALARRTPRQRTELLG